MGRAPCCSKDAGLNRGAWTAEEDLILTEYIAIHGDGGWKSLPQKAGLKRCGKSCRLRWLNYLRPDIKRGNISHDEEELIMRMHKLLGNRWSLIAGRLPGRTDNEIKNYWNTRLFRKIERGESRAPHEEKFIGKAKCPSHDPKNDDHVYKVVPVRTTVSRIENLHKRDLKSSISDNNIKLHASSNTKISKSWCELWTDELTADELVDIKLDQNSNSQPIEANEKISHFLTPNLIDDQFPHPAENETYAHNTSSNLNEISSYNCDLFSSMNAFSDDFRIGESESRQTNGIEKIYGKENFETFADCRDQVMEETSIDVDQVDWIKELLDCQI